LVDVPTAFLEAETRFTPAVFDGVAESSAASTGFAEVRAMLIPPGGSGDAEDPCQVLRTLDRVGDEREIRRTTGPLTSIISQT